LSRITARGFLDERGRPAVEVVLEDEESIVTVELGEAQTLVAISKLFGALGDAVELEEGNGRAN
jgi:hypothetical protein